MLDVKEAHARTTAIITRDQEAEVSDIFKLIALL